MKQVFSILLILSCFSAYAVEMENTRLKSLSYSEVLSGKINTAKAAADIIRKKMANDTNEVRTKLLSNSKLKDLNPDHYSIAVEPWSCHRYQHIWTCNVIFLEE